MGFLRKAWAVASAAVIVLGLGACANGADGATLAASSPEPEFVSPLEEFLGPVWGTQLSEEARIREAQASFDRWAELATQCMHDAGFEFDAYNIPISIIGRHFGGFSLPGSPPSAGTAIVDSRHPNNRDWVEQWGYGIVNQTPEEAAAAIGSEPADEPEMSYAESEAFVFALMGNPDDFMIVETVGAMTAWTYRDDLPINELRAMQGCRGWAENQRDAETPASLRTSYEFAPLFAAINQMRNDFQLSVTDADIDWAACMADAGFNRVQRQADAQEQVSDALFALLNSGNFDDTSPAWVALREHERNVALADLDCRVATDFTARHRAAQIEVETQFVNDNRTALEALRAAAEQIGN